MNKTWNLKEMKKLIPLALPVLVVNLSIVGMGLSLIHISEPTRPY